MLLHFPTLDVLRLALSTGAVPAEVAAAPVEAHTADGGAITIDAALPTASAKALQALGVAKVRTSAATRFTLPNWLALIPLARREPAVGDKTPVLLELDSGPRLAEVVAEILRLGNDRQSFRHLTSGETGRTLLRVLGPPYYTLLRALDAEAGQAEQPPLAAFVEQVPRVWVQLGYEHPLAERLEVPSGKWLFLRPPRSWEWIDEGPFQDIYGTLEFSLPKVDSAWHDQPLGEQIAVSLRLTSMAETDPAELWVLSHNAVQQLEQLVGTSDNELIARLAFAVVQRNEPAVSEVNPPPERTPLVLLRVRPSKLPPPVLVLDGVACRSYLNLPNLFVPVGRRLHPPLRRDVVTRLLAADASRLVWLEPSVAGQFQPRSIPDGAFHPLSAWVDYVLDEQHEPLAAWTAAHRFDFAGFVCREEEQPQDRSPRKAERPTEPRPAPSPAPSTPTSTSPEDEPIFAEVVEEEIASPVELARAVPQPSELQQRLSAAENQFLAIAGPLDSPERAILWREMAHLNGALDRRLDASLCWSQVLWEQPAAPRDAAVAWLGHLGENGSGPRFPAPDKLRTLAEGGMPERLELTQLAAQLVRQAADKSMSVESRLSPEQISLAGQILTRHEQILPIRIAWLAWVAIAELSHGDTLALARARDRLLERMFQQGLTAEHDLPGFLRAGSGADADRQRVLGERLRSLRDEVVEWIHEPPSPLAQTRRYAELVFAYGLARLGESAEAERIVAWVRQQMNQRDNVHAWALRAFEQRIAEAAAGTRGTQLSPDLLSIMEWMDRNERYKADRLREQSRIIEPFERIKPYRNFHRRYADEFERELAQLVDVADPGQLAARLEQLWTSPPPAAQKPGGRMRLLTAALELAPRLGADYAGRAIDRVLPVWDAADDVIDRACLLEKALQAAAHFDHREAVQTFVERFETSLPSIIDAYLNLQVQYSADKHERLVAIELLFQQSLRGLRKLGLRDEIGRIFAQIVELARGERSATPKSRKAGRPTHADPTRGAKLLLTVAGGWFFFGQHEEARPIVEEVRRQLFIGELIPAFKASLACAYVAAVGQAPLDIALPLVRELFARDSQSGKPLLHGVADAFATSTHYSLGQYRIVEATVLTLISDEHVLSAETRRWLEEDEFLVRRRIHRDVRRATEG
jgi:hypothetical protein